MPGEKIGSIRLISTVVEYFNDHRKGLRLVYILDRTGRASYSITKIVMAKMLTFGESSYTSAPLKVEFK